MRKYVTLSFGSSVGHTLCRTDCQLWDGDCGLKVKRGDRWKKAWERLKALQLPRLGTRSTFVDEMDKIEAEMGKG